MKTKITALLSGLVSFSSTVSAQGITTGGEGPLGGIGTGAIEFLSNLFGVNMSEPTQAIGFAAAFGILWLVVNVVMEVGLDKLNMLEYFQQSGRSHEGRNRMPILSFLVVISMLGTGAFTGVVTGLQTIILLVFVSAILAGLLAAVFGLPSGALLGIGGGMKALGFASDKAGIDGSGISSAVGNTAGKGAKAAEKGLNKAKDLMQQAEQDMQEVEKEEKEAKQNQDAQEAEHAADVEEKAEKELEESEEITENVLESELNQLKNTLDEAREVVSDESEEEEEIKGIHTSYLKLDDRLKAYAMGLEKYDEPTWNIFKKGQYSESSNLSGKYGTDVPPAELERTILDAMTKRTQRIRKIEKEEEELVRDELSRVTKESQEFRDILSVYKELRADIKEMEEEEKFLEKLSKKFEDRKLAAKVSQEEEYLKKMMEMMKQIEKEEEQVKNRLREVEQFLEKEVNTMTSNINKLQKTVNDSENIEKEMEKLRKIINQPGTFTKDKTKAANELINGWEQDIEQIESNVSKIAQRKQKEAKMVEKEAAHLKNSLKGL